METYCKIPLCNLNVNIWTGCKIQVVNISDSFFYKSLLFNDRKIYEKYRDLVNTSWPRILKDKKRGVVSKRDLPVCSYEDFYNIYESINTDGYDTEQPMIVERQKDSYVIVDGHHRASILLYINYNEMLVIKNKKAIPELS